MNLQANYQHKQLYRRDLRHCIIALLRRANACACGQDLSATAFDSVHLRLPAATSVAGRMGQFCQQHFACAYAFVFVFVCVCVCVNANVYIFSCETSSEGSRVGTLVGIRVFENMLVQGYTNPGGQETRASV